MVLHGCTITIKFDKKLISRSGRRTLWRNSNYRLNHAMVVNLYHSYIEFLHKVLIY